MMDVIKRSDAIKVLTEVLFDEPPYLNSMEKCEAFARKTFEDIPSAENKGEWIPCSERLPSESDDESVLATTMVDELRVIIMPAHDVKSWYLKGYVSAWMPLPKPWKGADDETD